jgi:hypothetical protein
MDLIIYHVLAFLSHQILFKSDYTNLYHQFILSKRFNRLKIKFCRIPCSLINNILDWVLLPLVYNFKEFCKLL